MVDRKQESSPKDALVASSSGYSTAEVKSKLAQLGLAPKKSLGQNFLVNRATCERLVARAQQGSPSAFIEVGPGLGALTHALMKTSVELTIIELDRAFAQYWREEAEKQVLGAKRLHVVEGDALRIDWDGLKLKERSCLVSNLPYQISSSLVIECSLGMPFIFTMILMFQKEVAQRMVARARTEDYGLLTVIAQTFWTIEFVVEVSAKDFYPPPQVASRVLFFTRRESSWTQGLKQAYLAFVKTAFAQRRKLLAANLSVLGSQVRSSVEKHLPLMGLSEKARAEELTVAQFQELFLVIKGVAT